MKRLAVCILLIAVGLEPGSTQLGRRGCDKVCPALYQPVCAKWGYTVRTFGNSCDLAVYNECNRTKFRFLYNGECKTRPRG